MNEQSRDVVARELQTVAAALTTPLPVECLLCYVWRMLDSFGCNATLRWARQWRGARAPRATSLEHRLGQHGGFCDCEIFLNGWVFANALRRDASDGGDAHQPVPPCSGVRRGSSQPCTHWIRRPRRWPES